LFKEFDKKRYLFSVLILTSTESFSFEKLVELEATAKLNYIDIIAVTDVQAQNPDLLEMTGFREFKKLRQFTTHWGRKEEE